MASRKATPNKTAEELLWRGLYIEVFSERWDLGVVYPTVAFALWHLAPQAVRHTPNFSSTAAWRLTCTRVGSTLTTQ